MTSASSGHPDGPSIGAVSGFNVPFPPLLPLPGNLETVQVARAAVAPSARKLKLD